VFSESATELQGLETALQKNSCQQRCVQKLEFQRAFDLDDGPQSLIVGPEAGFGDSPQKSRSGDARCEVHCELPAYRADGEIPQHGWKYRSPNSRT